MEGQGYDGNPHTRMTRNAIFPFSVMLTAVDGRSVAAEQRRYEKEINVSALALKVTKDLTMIPEFDAGGFINLSREQRIAKCREMAIEAERLAAGKSSEMRASYLDLARKWSDLADEMETTKGA
jgi:hypothetical protein